MARRWFIVLPFLLAACSHAPTVEKPRAENLYPSWFFNPPTGPTFAVGYSSEHAYRDSAIKAAVRQAARNFAMSHAVQIIGEQGLATLAAGTITVGSTIKEHFDTTEAGRLGESMKALDFFQRGNSVSVLASTDSLAGAPGGTRLDAAAVARPSWTTMLPDEPGYVYNSGLAPVYFNEFNSWLEAERKARINLALTIFTRVKFLGKKVEDTYFREFQVEETNVTLHGIQVVARWKDVRNKICYVLARVPVQR